MNQLAGHAVIRQVAGERDAVPADTSDIYKNFHFTFMLNESAAKAIGWIPQEAIDKT
ncbi:MAG TPA: hypothetical protein VNE41_07720 [Chitinophagaceae bacterium]|nr:hypothetical protein [Chitinophagaceae bacterium]